MKITYFGHSCFSVETNGYQILFDPYIRPNELAKHIDVDAIKADYILSLMVMKIILQMQFILPKEPELLLLVISK